MAEKTAAEKGTVSLDELELPLPYHFKVLKELFTAVETVVGIMQGRKEIAVFPKVKAGVQALMKKVSLREKHLAQMVTLMPGCYTFGLEKCGKETHIKVQVEHLVPSVICARRKAFHAALVKVCLEHHKVRKKEEDIFFIDSIGLINWECAFLVQSCMAACMSL